jgi:hypothetical protein
MDVIDVIEDSTDPNGPRTIERIEIRRSIADADRFIRKANWIIQQLLERFTSATQQAGEKVEGGIQRSNSFGNLRDGLEAESIDTGCQLEEEGIVEEDEYEVQDDGHGNIKTVKKTTKKMRWVNIKSRKRPIGVVPGGAKRIRITRKNRIKPKLFVRFRFLKNQKQGSASSTAGTGKEEEGGDADCVESPDHPGTFIRKTEARGKGPRQDRHNQAVVQSSKPSQQLSNSDRVSAIERSARGNPKRGPNVQSETEQTQDKKPGIPPSEPSGGRSKRPKREPRYDESGNRIDSGSDSSYSSESPESPRRPHRHGTHPAPESSSLSNLTR